MNLKALNSPAWPVLVVASTIGLPAAVLVALSLSPPSHSETLAACAMIAAYWTYSFLLLSLWPRVGFRVRNIATALLGVLLASSLVRGLSADSSEGGSPIVTIALWCLAIYFLIQVSLWYGVARSRVQISLPSPFRTGRFVVVQGGGSISNNHARFASLKYAVDIVQLSESSRSTFRTFPRELSDFACFGADIISPCEGIVAAVEDGCDDNAVGVREVSRPAGNCVTIDVNGALVYFAHLKRGSITVKSGQHVRIGDAIGRVGNSGNSTEPHLHLHIEQDGCGVLFSLDGRLPRRNTVICGRDGDARVVLG
jgi:Peptidase family M23